MERENLIEAAIVIAFFTAILFLGPGTAAGHKLRHEIPTGYAASDSYQHQTRAQAIYDMGQYRKEAPYMMMGLKDVVGFYPPVLPHATVLTARISRLPVHDSLQLLMGIALSLAALITYYLARSMGKAIALLSLPLTLFITTGAPFLGIVTFGQMPFGLSSLFLITTAWAITKLSLKKGFLLSAAALSGSIMTHTSETLFLFIFLTAYFSLAAAARVSKHRLNGIKMALKENKGVIAVLGISTAATLYFWPIFIGIWLKMQPYRGIRVETESASFPAATVHLWQTFGLFTVAIIAGIIFTILLAVQKRKELARLINEPKLFPAIFSAWMLLAGFGTYLGFGLRSFQTRLFWPISLAPLAGFGLYQAIKPAARLIGKKGSSFTAVAVITVLLGAFVVTAYYKEPSPVQMPKQHWEALRWIAENAPEDAKVWVMYSPTYSQTSILYNDEHVNYFVERQEEANMLNQAAANNGTGQVGRTWQASIATDSGAGLPYRKGLLSFERHTSDTATNGKFDICSADYYLVDFAFPEQEQGFAQLNIYITKLLLANNITAAYQNEYLAILKNNNKGGECLAR